MNGKKLTTRLFFILTIVTQKNFIFINVRKNFERYLLYFTFLFGIAPKSKQKGLALGKITYPSMA